MNIPTPLGKLIRQIRLDSTLTQHKFGESIGVTSAYISAVEIGKKTLSEDRINKIIELYDLKDDVVRKLKAFAAIQASEFSVKVSEKTPWEKRKLAYLFSKKLPTISEDTVEKIVELLNSDKGK